MNTRLGMLLALIAGIVTALAVQGGDEPRALGPLPDRGSIRVEAPSTGFEVRVPSTQQPESSAAGSVVATAGSNLASAGRSSGAAELGVARRAIDAALVRAIEGEWQAAVERAREGTSGSANAGNCRFGYQIVDLDSGTVIAERAPEETYEPASNLKLVTTLAGLVVLGPDWEFVTTAEASGGLSAGVLDGDLVVRAGGDPLFEPGNPGYAATRIERFVAELRAAGVRRVRGDLVYDLGEYPEPGPASGWPSSNASWTGSYAYVSGLTANGGQVNLAFRAGDAGRTTMTMSPSPNGLSARGSVRATSSSINDVRIGLIDAQARVDLAGEFGPPGRTFERDIRHPDPVAMFAALFETSLQRAGIRVDGATRRDRGVERGSVLATLRTPWIGLLDAINRDSENGVADAVFLAIGGAVEGAPTRDAARAGVARSLDGLGVPTDGFHQVGGSGLSRDNRVSPAMLVQLIRRVDAMPDRARDALFGSLAVAGMSGTLENRMDGTVAEGRVRAKTGFIVGASALSGLAEGLDGRRYAFSLLVGYPRIGGLNNSAWKPMHDAIAVRLVERSSR